MMNLQNQSILDKTTKTKITGYPFKSDHSWMGLIKVYWKQNKQRLISFYYMSINKTICLPLTCPKTISKHVYMLVILPYVKQKYQ